MYLQLCICQLNPIFTCQGVAKALYQKINFVLLKSLFYFTKGCSSPIVVKFADTEKDKLLKRVNAMATIHGLNAAYYQQVGLNITFQ